MLAIAMALNAVELDVIGSRSLRATCRSSRGRAALQLLELLGREDVPVYVGAEKSLL